MQFPRPAGAGTRPGAVSSSPCRALRARGRAAITPTTIRFAVALRAPDSGVLIATLFGGFAAAKLWRSDVTPPPPYARRVVERAAVDRVQLALVATANNACTVRLGSSVREHRRGRR